VNALASDLGQVVESAFSRLSAISESASQRQTIPGAWTPKEILGHLIDSAANNHQRFVRAQFSDNLVFPGYDQEQWVKAQHCDQEVWRDLIHLWRSYNLHLAHVVANIPENALKDLRAQHSLDRIAWRLVPANAPTNLEYLVRDYIGHMQEHLEQIFAIAEPK
jgi:hypothetical protein